MHKCDDCVEESLLVEAFGGSPMIRIIDLLIDNELYDMSKREVGEALGMSKPTVISHFRNLERMGLVKAVRKVGKTSMYRLDYNNYIIRKLKEIDSHLTEAGTLDPVRVEARREPLNN